MTSDQTDTPVESFKLEAPEPVQAGRRLADKNAWMTFIDLPEQDVRIPEMERKGGPPVYVRVRGLTGKERDRYEESITIGKGKDKDINARNARAKLVVMCVVDEQGNRVFSDADVAWLGEKSAVALERIFDVARKLSGLSDTDVKELTEDF